MNKPLVLHLVLKHEYYDQIKDGKKLIEYRRNTPYWRKRIIEQWDSNGGNIVIFHKGYTNITMTFNIEKYILNMGMIELHLGDRIGKKKARPLGSDRPFI